MITQEQWEKACDTAKIEKWADWCGFHESGHPYYTECRCWYYPPIGDPATVLKMAERVFQYNEETNVHLTNAGCFLWARTNRHTYDTRSANFIEAVVCAAQTLPEDQE